MQCLLAAFTTYPTRQFAQAVKQHQTEFTAKGFTCWEQFVAMLFCQVAHLNSLREVCLGLAGCESPLKHLGIRTAPKKSTLAYANAHRPWELYQSIFMQLLDKCQTETATRTRRKFRFKNKRMSLDGSITRVIGQHVRLRQVSPAKGRDQVTSVLGSRRLPALVRGRDDGK